MLSRFKAKEIPEAGDTPRAGALQAWESYGGHWANCLFSLSSTFWPCHLICRPPCH